MNFTQKGNLMKTRCGVAGLIVLSLGESSSAAPIRFDFGNGAVNPESEFAIRRGAIIG
jgi:hypothetical protein